MAVARTLIDRWPGALASVQGGWLDRSWNPLACGGTSLPPNRLLSGKLLALFLLVQWGPLWTPHIHLPFLPFLDHLGPAAPLLERGMTVAFLFFAVALFVNRIPRTSCFALGVLVLLSILMDRTTFANNKTFTGCFLLLLGLQEPDRSPWLLRAQLVLVYFGAGINKFLDPDWQSGAYFEFWTHAVLEHRLYMDLAASLPPLVLSKIMCWFVIVTELGLALGFALPRLVHWAIPLGLVFHAGMLVFTGGEVSWSFMYAMSAAFVAVASWPATSLEVQYRGWLGRTLRRLLERLDFEGLYEWREVSPVPEEASADGPAPAERGEVETMGVPISGRLGVVARAPQGSRRARSGARAVLVLLLVNPVFYLPVAVYLLWFAVPEFVERTVYLLRRTLVLMRRRLFGW